MTQTGRGKQEQKSHRVLNGFNKVIAALQRLGIVFGPMQILTVTGRKSGLPRHAPVAVMSLSGERYIFQAYPKAAWVANARAAGTATLSMGRRSATVSLVELPVAERGAVLRELAASSPAVGKRLAQNGLAESGTVESVVAAAPRITMFRVDQPDV
jgi:deazaflavin-dependent oxidoreductase (nitroreductase family)